MAHGVHMVCSQLAGSIVDINRDSHKVPRHTRLSQLACCGRRDKGSSGVCLVPFPLTATSSPPLDITYLRILGELGSSCLVIVTSATLTHSSYCSQGISRLTSEISRHQPTPVCASITAPCEPCFACLQFCISDLDIKSSSKSSRC